MAEWESEGAILIALPTATTDWAYMLEEAEDQYRRLIDAFTAAGERVVALCADKDDAAAKFGAVMRDKCLLIPTRYNDTWTRDYGPLTIERDGERHRALDFEFNGWGLKFAANFDNLVNTSLILDPQVIRRECYRNNRDYTLEGGSVETDGNGTILTTSNCLCSLNRNGSLTKGEINEILRQRLGAEHVLWLDYGALEGDDTDSHIDTLARMAPNNTIIYVGAPDPGDSHHEEMTRMREQIHQLRNICGEPYNLVELPFAGELRDSEGNRLPATYANYLVTRRNLFIPTYGDPQRDELAKQIIHSVFPDKEAHTVDCRALTCQHGSLHCATMQLPRQILNPGILTI
jgi:agmatine/peptidylarginine deiminase